jgi:hypothetical protein
MVARKEARPNPSSRCSERQGCRKPPSIRDTSRGDHWSGRDCINHCRNERHAGDTATNVPTCLPTLGDNDVDRALDRTSRVLGRGDGMHEHCASRLCAPHQCGWVDSVGGAVGDRWSSRRSSGQVTPHVNVAAHSRLPMPTGAEPAMRSITGIEQFAGSGRT